MKSFLRPILFLSGGAAAGWLFYTLYGCRTGCMISSSPIRSMLYMAVVGGLIYYITKKGD